MRRTLSWIALAIVVGSALVIGTVDRDGPQTDAERARHLAAGIRCPTCAGQSALESQAAPARAIRAEIDRRITQGQSDAEIRDYLVSRFGEDIRMSPAGRGVAGLVWVIPVAVAIVAAAALVFGFARWRARPARAVADEDRALVEQARRRREAPTG